MKKILLILCTLFISTANADVLDDCLKKIESETTSWQDVLSNNIFNYLGPNDELTREIVQTNRQRIYALLARNIEKHCTGDIALLIKVGGRKTIFFTYKNKKYGFDFDLMTALNYANDIRTGILVINKTDLSTADIVKVSDFPAEQHFFSDECSDHEVKLNLDNKAAVNVAGQTVFGEFGGKKHEFFLDFSIEKKRRVFPGLVLMDKTHSIKEQIVSYVNPVVGLQKVQQFAEQLKGSACSNQRLAVYLVALDVKNVTTDYKKENWVIGLLSGGGIAAGVSVVFSTPIGWIVAGLTTVTSAVISLNPTTIEKIDQVQILDGPYIL